MTLSEKPESTDVAVTQPAHDWTSAATARQTAELQAAVQARFLVALQRPRNIHKFRQDLLSACSRPAFAAVARYKKPAGRDKTFDGPSIRFADAAVQLFGNIHIDNLDLFEDEEIVKCRVSCTDLEANHTKSKEFTVHKTVERSYAAQGREVLSKRLNTKGNITYLLRATEDEVSVKKEAKFSYYRRGVEIQMLPWDIVEEAMQLCTKTQLTEAENDRRGTLNRVVDSFASLGIPADTLASMLSHDLDTCTPDDLQMLREAYTALREGHCTLESLLGQVPQDPKVAPSFKDRVLDAKKTKKKKKPKKAEAKEGNT